MTAARLFSLVFVTAPDLKVARSLVRRALESRLVACGNIIPGLESHYWWEGKLDRSSEILILFKTTAAAIKPLEKLILTHHPYDTPEFIVLPISHGSERYLRWISESVPSGQPNRKAAQRRPSRPRS